MSVAVTIREVAARAGVSVATVSRVLSRDPEVSAVAPETRGKVLKACVELGYRLQHVGRALRTGRSGLVGVVIRNLGDPFNSLVLQGIDAATCGSEWRFHIDPIAVQWRMDIYEQIYLSRMGDAMIVVGHLAEDEKLNRRLVAICPKTVLIAHPPVGRTPRVITDYSKSVGLALGHLRELGHRKVGFAYNPEAWAMKERFRAFRAHTRRMGIQVFPEWVVMAPGTFEGGRQALGKWAKLQRRPTAIVLANDSMAIGAIREAAVRGLAIPDEMSIVGAGNIPFSEYTSPPLTTVDERTQFLGEVATRLLLDWLDGKALPPRTPVVVEVELVIRETTSPPTLRPTVGRHSTRRGVIEGGH